MGNGGSTADDGTMEVGGWSNKRPRFDWDQFESLLGQISNIQFMDRRFDPVLYSATAMMSDLITTKNPYYYEHAWELLAPVIEHLQSNLDQSIAPMHKSWDITPELIPYAHNVYSTEFQRQLAKGLPGLESILIRFEVLETFLRITIEISKALDSKEPPESHFLREYSRDNIQHVFKRDESIALIIRDKIRSALSSDQLEEIEDALHWLNENVNVARRNIDTTIEPGRSRLDLAIMTENSRLFAYIEYVDMMIRLIRVKMDNPVWRFRRRTSLVTPQHE